MKLKKIASLMLAGIMAVSMLAGCKTADNGGNGGEGEGEGTQTSGYSAVMADAVSDKVKDMEHVTFQDNGNDQTALKNAMNYLGEKALSEYQNFVAPWSVDGWTGKGWDEFQDVVLKGIDSDSDHLGENDLGCMWWYNSDGVRNQDVKCGAVYVVDGNVGVNEAIKMVANDLKTTFENGLKDTVTVETADSGTLVYDYSYVISVSVANKTIGDQTVNFILVTTARTVNK